MDKIGWQANTAKLSRDEEGRRETSWGAPRQVIPGVGTLDKSKSVSNRVRPISVYICFY